MLAVKACRLNPIHLKGSFILHLYLVFVLHLYIFAVRLLHSIIHINNRYTLFHEPLQE